jgi:hypothetical protein
MTARRLHPWTRIAARIGTRALLIGMVAVLALGLSPLTGVWDRLPETSRSVLTLAPLVSFLLFGFGLATAHLPRPGRFEPRAIAAPIRGRCLALNGPATKVPSHGMHAFAQTYAIDLLHEPAPGQRPTFGGRRAMRDPSEYPSFGRPVHAPADAIVTRVVDGARDHRCRSNLLGYLYMVVEGLVLQLRGARGLMGNHVVLQLDDDTHVALAHLQRDSVQVRVGDRVSAGEVIAAIGNSGNTSEPHVHLQLMDRARPIEAVGLPFVFTDVAASEALDPPEDAGRSLVPENGTIFHAGVGRVRR